MKKTRLERVWKYWNRAKRIEINIGWDDDHPWVYTRREGWNWSPPSSKVIEKTIEDYYWNGWTLAIYLNPEKYELY